MKTLLKTLSISILLAGAGNAFASASADLTVSGKLVPAVCTLSIEKGGKIDLGSISVQSLSTSTDTLLDKHYSIFQVKCSAPTKIALSIVDNRHSSVASGQVDQFGLGFQGTQILGFYEVGVSITKPILADGSQAAFLRSKDAGASWAPKASWFTSTEEYSFGSVGTYTPGAFTLYTATLAVQTHLTPPTKLDVSSPVALDGSATLQISYL